MGYYIKPLDKTKEAFLWDHGELVSRDVVLSHDLTGAKLPVALVDNGAFTAAGICWDRHEVEAFTRLSETRPILYFLVPKEVLKPYLPKGK